MKNYMDEIKQMSKEELQDLFFFTMGIYTKNFKDLPLVYCPICGHDLRPKDKQNPVGVV